MTKKKESVTIAAVEVSNFRRLRVAHVEYVPGIGLVRVTGANSSGKTSLLKAIAGALGGAEEVHAGSLQEGAEEGRVMLRLTNGYTIERKPTAANPKGHLTIKGPDGGRHTQAKLDEWLGPRSFDPLAFFSLAPERQRDALFAIGTDPELGGKLERSRADQKKAYDRRTPVISRQQELRKVIKAKPDGARPEPVDTSAEMGRLRELQGQERKRQDGLRAHERARETAAAGARDALKKVEFQMRGVQEDLTRNDEAQLATSNRIAELRREMVAAEAQLEELKKRHGRSVADFDALAEKLRVLPEEEEAADAVPVPDLPADVSEEMEAVQQKLSLASLVERAIEPWRRWESATAELKALDEQEENLTTELGSLRRRESELLEKAGIPIAGLSFSEKGEPLLNGRPLALASGRERIDFAVQVALAADPDLRVCLVDEANDLDLDALEQLDALARAHAFQVWVVRIGLEGPGEITVEDGEAIGAAVAAES